MNSRQKRRMVDSLSMKTLFRGFLVVATTSCEPRDPLPPPVQWQWNQDQTVCRDPNGFSSKKNQYPTIDIRQIVVRDDESVFGVGVYTLPSQGLPSLYGEYLGTGEIWREGPHTFKFDVASGGASAQWSAVNFYHMGIQPLKACESGPWDGTQLIGPFIDKARWDVVFYRKNLDIHICAGKTTSTCKLGELSKQATPQWSLGTTEICAHEAFSFAGGAAGDVVTAEDDRLKKYDPSGAVVLDVPQPFGFAPTAMGLGIAGDIHAATQTATEVRIARSNASGALVWAKSFPNTVPMLNNKNVDLAVDAAGNTLVSFYAHTTMNLGNGPLAALGRQDTVLAKFGVQGNLLWAKRIGGGDVIRSMMRKTGANDIALVVHFEGSVKLDNGLHLSSPVLIKYDPSGNQVWQADLLSLYPSPSPEVLSVAIAGHPSGAVFVAGTGYGEASSTPGPNCDLGASYLPGTYPRPLRMFTTKIDP